MLPPRSRRAGITRILTAVNTKRGAHLLLQIRTRVLDGTIRFEFERWYPGLANDNTGAIQATAA